MTKKICFVVQEFNTPSYEELYDDVIAIAVKEADAHCARADKILGGTQPLEKIKSAIEAASIVIAEVTPNNPNVFFEVGYALALNKCTFIVWDQYKRPAKELPFDVHGLAGIPYDSSKVGWRKELRAKLIENITFELSNSPESNPESNITISELLNKYLPYCEKYNSVRSHEWYMGHIKNFLKYMGKDADELASSLKPSQVEEWLDKQKGWGPTYTRGAISALQVAYNWAVERKYITENPIKNIIKPKAIKRDNPMPLVHYESILSRIDKNDSFRDLLILVWHTDCRPEEVRNLEGQHIDLERKCIRMPQGGARAKQKPRIIYLNQEALEILTKLKAKHSTGKLFLNTRKKPWTKFALCNRLYRYSQAIGESYALSDCRNGAIARIAA